MNLKINYTSNISGILTVNDYSKQDEKFDDVKYQVDKEIDVSDEYVQEQKNNQNQLIMDESINDFMMHDVDPLTGDFYDSNYDQIRRDKVIFLMQLFTPYEKFKQMSYRQKNLFIKQFERKIYNVTIEKAIEQNIINSWSIREFVLIYHMISYKLTANIDNNWLVNNTSLTDQMRNTRTSSAELKLVRTLNKRLNTARYTYANFARETNQSMKSCKTARPTRVITILSHV